MRNFVIGKLQYIVTLVAVVLIAALAFTPLISINADPVSDTKNFYKIIDTAEEKELDMLLESAADDAEYATKSAEIKERYENLRADLVSDGASETAGFDVSVANLIKYFPDAVSFMLYYFEAFAIDYVAEAGGNYVGDQVGGALDGVETPGVDTGFDEIDKEVEDAENQMKEDVKNEATESTKQQIEAEGRKALYDSIDPAVVNAETIGMFRLFFGGTVSMSELDGEQTVFNTIVLIIFTIIKLALLFSIVIGFPIAMAFCVLRLVLSLISKKRGQKALKYCKSAVTWLGTLLVTVIVWGASLTSTAKLFIAVVAVAIGVNLLASRFKSYSRGAVRFLNILQLTSAVSIAGVVIFAKKLVDADLFNFYLSGGLYDQIRAYCNGDLVETAKAVAIFTAMAALTIVALGFVFKSAMKLVTRAACMGKKGGTGLFVGIMGLALLIVNGYVISNYNVTLAAEQESAMTMAMVGIIITLVGAIAYKVLSNIFLKGVTSSEKADVLNGTVGNK